MQLDYGLYQQQLQKLVMTPELRQAITMLQLSTIELTAYLENEMVENPVLEIEDKELARYDFLYNNYSHRSGLVNYSQGDEWNIWDTIATPSATLEEHLLEQVRFLSLGKMQYEVIKFLIGSLDETGYLNIALDEVANRFNITEEKVEACLEIIQTLEPIGVGARNLKESLLIQLKYIDPIDPYTIEIVTNHLNHLGDHKFVKIAQEMNISLQEVQQVSDFIKTLNPKPAMSFPNGSPRYILPDIFVEYVEGEYIVVVNDTLIPRLKINSHYHRYVQENKKDDETTQYIMERFNAAKWLMKSIDQRKNTLYKVTNAIIKHQKGFLESNQLKPLTLKDIAEEIGVHESTVSRAVNQKYVQTPVGIFELKYFFTTGLATSDGATTSVENVKKSLQEVIDQEDKRKPLSDQKLAKLLNDQGIEISRRTIAKYREELGIHSSSGRKRYDL